MERRNRCESDIAKRQMSEEDIKLQYITPSIVSKWSRDKITMETLVTDGKINLKGNFVFREKPKRADYILYLSANNPIQFIEENISLIDEQCFKYLKNNTQMQFD